jgi:hypothetical protein
MIQPWTCQGVGLYLAWDAILLKKTIAELSIEAKQQWQEEEVYTLPITTSATGVISHTLHDLFKQLDLSDLLYATQQRSVILSTCTIGSLWVKACFSNR